jgi:exosortase
VPSPSAAERLRPWLAPRVLWVSAPLAAALAAFCVMLWPQWSRNPDLSHGFFTPLIFLVLLEESRTRGTLRWLPAGRLLTAATVASALGCVLVFALAGLLAASVGWSHALVSFLLAASLAGLLFTGLLCLADDRVRLVPFNWPSLVAIGLWLLASPLPLGTYTRLTLTLQGWVSGGVLECLHILGIPARQYGNIIQLANTTVGIEEACSGIRSLLSCLYAGLFFSAWQVRRPARRASLIVLAPLLAIGMNFLRSLTLTLMANGGVSIDGFWHDATGYAILGVTALVLAWLSLVLSPAEPSPATSPSTAPAGQGHSGRLFALGFAGVAALALFFATYGRPVAVSTATPREVTALLPDGADAAGWQVMTARDLYQFSAILQTSQLAEKTYLRLLDGRPAQVNVYIAHWEAGQAPVSQVASHTPDACWPGSGWAAQSNPAPQAALRVAGEPLPVAEHRIFLNPANQPQHVWFWHVYNGRVISYRDPYSVRALIELGLKYGFRREGDQYFIRVSSNLPWEAFADDPLLQRLVANLKPYGSHP